MPSESWIMFILWTDWTFLGEMSEERDKRTQEKESREVRSVSTKFPDKSSSSIRSVSLPMRLADQLSLKREPLSQRKGLMALNGQQFGQATH